MTRNRHEQVILFTDHNVPSIYPRWVAYMNLGGGFLIFPAGLLVFFKDGPFASHTVTVMWPSAA